MYAIYMIHVYSYMMLLSMSDCMSTPADSGRPLIYRVQQRDGSESFLFHMTADGGLVVTSYLDYEQEREHRLVLTVSDDGSPPLTGTAQLTVNGRRGYIVGTGWVYGGYTQGGYVPAHRHRPAHRQWWVAGEGIWWVVSGYTVGTESGYGLGVGPVYRSGWRRAPASSECHW